jgi:tetratricopeptide (TPR) repeat protein
MKKKRVLNNKINNKNPDKIHSSQLLPFAISLGIFMIAAVFGWIKLRYGFNFIDEGYHMTEAWRLTVGDNFFSDRFTGALMLSTFINALVFKLYPGITLLGFRELQFTLTIISLLPLSFALYKISKDFWFQPLIFSIFAFTGLDPIGMISNLYYHTYPHLFITLYLAFFILGVHQQSVVLKRILYITAGVFLWLISFSLLHMSLVVISVVLLFVIIKTFKLKSLNFDFKDLCFVVVPVLLLWVIFIGIYGNAFIQDVILSVQMVLSTPNHSAGSLISINWEALKHIIITLIFTIAFLWSTKISKTVPLVGVLSILAVMIFAVIDTSLFGLITPYYNGWFGRPMWLAALLVSSYLLFLYHFIFKIVKKKPWNDFELLALILFITGIIASINGSIFSGMGFLAVLHSSIPAVAAMACAIMSMETIKKRVYLVKLTILFLFFVPFYYTTAWSDWKFTFFDVAPEQANVEIETGFGKGIKTNPAYKDLYGWISATSQAYSNKDDYVISYVVSPMVHMIARRRPALDDTFISFAVFPQSYYHKAIEFMKNRGRKPQLAYIFEAMPALMPVTLEDPKRIWFGKEFSFPSDDPISQYVLDNMTPIQRFPISNELSVGLFLDNVSALRVLENKLKNDPAHPVLNMLTGNIYQRNGDLDKAKKYYRKALDANPKFIQALQHLANQSMKENDLAATILLKNILVINPDQIDGYYNIACMYARQKQIADSIIWLTKAVDNGFNNWRLLQTDHNLDNIRGTKYYKDILKKLQDAQIMG